VIEEILRDVVVNQRVSRDHSEFIDDKEPQTESPGRHPENELEVPADKFEHAPNHTSSG
jgi:hypothetical protein